MRADSGFHAAGVVAVCRKLDVRFSVTIRQQPNVRRLTEAIPEDAWTPIPYWLPGGADVAETTYAPVRGQEGHGPRPAHRPPGPPKPGSQLAAFVLYDYHAFITDRIGGLGQSIVDCALVLPVLPGRGRSQGCGRRRCRNDHVAFGPQDEFGAALGAPGRARLSPARSC